MYILEGNDSFFLPTKYYWQMREKLWPSIVRTIHAEKITTKNLIRNIIKKIEEKFITEVIIQTTNEISKQTAALLCRHQESTEKKTRERWNQVDIQLYNNLMEKLCLLLKSDALQVLFSHIFKLSFSEYSGPGDNKKRRCLSYVFCFKSLYLFHHRVFQPSLTFSFMMGFNYEKFVDKFKDKSLRYSRLIYSVCHKGYCSYLSVTNSTSNLCGKMFGRHFSTDGKIDPN